jgi:hypothetical protein
LPVASFQFPVAGFRHFSNRQSKCNTWGHTRNAPEDYAWSGHNAYQDWGKDGEENFIVEQEGDKNGR